MTGKVAGNLSEVPSEFMPCRAFRKHLVSKTNDTVTTNRYKQVIEFTRYEHCERCGRESWTTYSVPDWSRVRSKSIYPDNYTVKGGLKGPEAKNDYLERLGHKIAKPAKGGT